MTKYLLIILSLTSIKIGIQAQTLKDSLLEDIATYSPTSYSLLMKHDDLESSYRYSKNGSSISTIHLKDRILNGGPVLMGKGNSDFFKLFKKIKDINYTGLYTMQVYRDNEGLKIFEKQLKYLKKILKDTNNHDY